jgi:hypothetical protein
MAPGNVSADATVAQPAKAATTTLMSNRTRAS